MNGKKAKKIRKEIYGDYSLQINRDYIRIDNNSNTIMNNPNSLRYQYLRAKKEYKNHG